MAAKIISRRFWEARQYIHPRKSSPKVLRRKAQLQPESAVQQLVAPTPRKIYINPHAKVAGRFRLFISNWQQLSSDSWVLQAVSGYQIEFLQCPFQGKPPIPHRFADEQVRIISDEVQALLDKGGIVECIGDSMHGEFIFLVPKPGGKFQPVINLRKLYNFVMPHHFKMEGLHSVHSLRRLHGEGRPERRVLYHSDGQLQSKFLRFRWKQRKRADLGILVWWGCKTIAREIFTWLRPLLMNHAHF